MPWLAIRRGSDNSQSLEMAEFVFRKSHIVSFFIRYHIFFVI